MQPYDMVVIGAGLSGLMAAYQMKNRDILVLEKAGRCGGRVLTRSRQNITYDLGAVFGIDQRALPKEFTGARLISEDKRIGLFWDGRVNYGTGVMECLSALGMSEKDREAIRKFRADPAHDTRLLPGHIYKAVNAFFQVIHPGEMKEYLACRRLDGLMKYGTAHCEGGNGVFIGQFENRLGHRVKLNAEVRAVSEEQDDVRVRYVEGTEEKEILARTVMLTVPAPVVLKILDKMNPVCRSFLSSLRYGEGTVVALGFRDTELARFSYIVTPDLLTNTILKQSTRDGGTVVLLVYYAGNKSVQLKGKTEDEIVSQTLDVLTRLKIGNIERENQVFSEVCSWPMVGPIISDESYLNWDERVVRPSKRVFLGGEYVHVDSRNVLPYGMVPALCSGKSASDAANRFIKTGNFDTDFQVHVSRYEMSAEKPVFIDFIEEGNIAPYGLILQADPDEALKRYLMENSRDSLWEWQKGFGVTAEDSALVIEGLLEAGVEARRLMPSLQRLVDIFFSPADSAFLTIRHGRAPYWRGPSIDATAHVGYLLQRIAPEIYGTEIEACARYLQKNQQGSGCWRGKWFPSTMITTYYAIRLLCLMDSRYASNTHKARQYMLAHQKPNGSWGDSVIETSAAILALTTLGLEDADLTRAKAWLLAQKNENGWRGEPVLYYWFELSSGQKFFHHCRDKGRMTTAWAMLALRDL